MLVNIADLEVLEEPAAPTFLHRHTDLLSELVSEKLTLPLALGLPLVYHRRGLPERGDG
jgi:hypothetical protein